MYCNRGWKEIIDISYVKYGRDRKKNRCVNSFFEIERKISESMRDFIYRQENGNIRQGHK